jgi:hypothetical protein
MSNGSGSGASYWPRTDRIPQPKPPLPVIPAAGGTFLDPMFHSNILRVSDGNSVAGVLTSHRTPSAPMQRMWSASSRNFYTVGTQGEVFLWSFDPLTFTAVYVKQLTFDMEPACAHADPDLMYSRGYRGPDAEACVQSYKISTDTYTTLVGVRDIVPNVDANGRTYLRGVSTGGSEWLSFIFGGQGQDADHYASYFQLGITPPVVVTLDTVAGTVNGSPVPPPAGASWGWYLHSSMMDQSGRFIILGPTQSQPANNVVWDTATHTFTLMDVHGGGHGAGGFGAFINMPDDNDGMQVLYRSLSTPATILELVQPYPTPPEFQIDSHVSWTSARFDSYQFCGVSTYRYGSGVTDGIWREWDDEVLTVQPYGPTLVRRYAQHRSDARHDTIAGAVGFWYTPRVNISPDGRWMAFTSNCEKTLGNDPGDAAEGCGYRQDVFVIKLVA